jgi:branched-chain amino acid transport system substrate-binding protein
MKAYPTGGTTMKTYPMAGQTMKACLAALLLCLPAAAQAAETLKIGALASLSGPGAAWGQAILYAAELAADDVNGKGGLKVGDKTYTIQIVPYDDKYQANEAVTAVNRLVFEDKVHFIMGPMGGATVLAVGPTTEKNKVITMTMAFTPLALGAEKPYSFRPVLTTTETSQAQIDWVVKTRGIKKVGGLFPNDETGQKIVVDLEKSYTKAGAPLVAKELFERDRLDMVPLLTRLMAKGIDAIELDGNAPTTSGLIVKQARELGFKGLIIRSGGPSTPEILSVAGVKATEGMIVYSPIDPANRAIKAYEDRYRSKYGKQMNGFSPSFYDATHMLFTAMASAGTVTDTDKVRVALEAMKDYRGIMGTTNWTGKALYGSNHQIDFPFYVAEVKDGKEVIRATCSLSLCK